MLFLRIDVTCPWFQMQRLQTTKKISESKSLYRTLTRRSGGGEAGHSSVIGIRSGILPPSDVSQPSAPTHFRSLLLRINQLHGGFTRFPDLLVTNCSCSILRPPTHVLKKWFTKEDRRVGLWKRRRCRTGDMSRTHKLPSSHRMKKRE